jgi:hypothetical protein
MRPPAYDFNLSPEARDTFDALGGGLARGGELFRKSGIQDEQKFLLAVQELTAKGLVNVEGDLGPSAIMLAVVSARPSAYDFVQRSKRAW